VLAQGNWLYMSKSIDHSPEMPIRAANNFSLHHKGLSASSIFAKAECKSGSGTCKNQHHFDVCGQLEAVQ